MPEQAEFNALVAEYERRLMALRAENSTLYGLLETLWSDWAQGKMPPGNGEPMLTYEPMARAAQMLNNWTERGFKPKA